MGEPCPFGEESARLHQHTKLATRNVQGVRMCVCMLKEEEEEEEERGGAIAEDDEEGDVSVQSNGV